MDIYDEFPGDYFKAAELVGKKPLPVTIAACEKQEMNDGKKKPVLKFDEDPRGLVLNQENRDVLVERFGRDTRAWAGKKITLITRRVNGPNGPCPGIRFADLPISELIDDGIPGDWASPIAQEETATPPERSAAPTKRKSPK
jgi:hypothetical protein